MQHGDPQACDEKPDYVEQGIQASGHFPFIYFEGPTERPEAERSDLDHLETEGYADDGHHHGHTTQEVSNGSGQSTEKEPDDIAQEIQFS